MCILLCTVSHPDYAFVLGSNRDEFFSRPTRRAEFIDKEEKYLMPVDLARPEHGTWIGVGKNGRICVLVNYREDKYPCQMGELSRGSIPKDFLQSELDPISWVHDIKKRSDNFRGIGGFSLFFGILKKDNIESSMYVISNRTDEIMKPFEHKDGNHNQIVGLSNSLYFEPWPKVARGKELINSLVDEAKRDAFDGYVGDEDHENTMEKMFDIMSDQYDGIHAGDSMAENITETVKHTVFVPFLKNDLDGEWEHTQGGYYGTRTQTVILVSHDGHLTYAERDLSVDGVPLELVNLPGQEIPQLQLHEFDIV